MQWNELAYRWKAEVFVSFNPMTKVETVDLFITFRFGKSTKNKGRAVPKGIKLFFFFAEK
jgi:hypothetical protein